MAGSPPAVGHASDNRPALATLINRPAAESRRADSYDTMGHTYVYLPDADVGLIHSDNVYSQHDYATEDILFTGAEIDAYWDGQADILVEAQADARARAHDPDACAANEGRREDVFDSGLLPDATDQLSFGVFDGEGRFLDYQAVVYSVRQFVQDPAFPAGYLQFASDLGEQDYTHQTVIEHAFHAAIGIVRTHITEANSDKSIAGADKPQPGPAIDALLLEAFLEGLDESLAGDLLGEDPKYEAMYQELQEQFYGEGGGHDHTH